MSAQRRCPVCSKLYRGDGGRARLYCPRVECALVAATIPQPTVDVVHRAGDRDHHIDVILSRDNKARSYTGAGASPAEAVKDVVEKVLGDHRNAEFIPRK